MGTKAGSFLKSTGLTEQQVKDVLSAANGITYDSTEGIIKLGGELSENTFLNLKGNNFKIEHKGSDFLDSSTVLEITDTFISQRVISENDADGDLDVVASYNIGSSGVTQAFAHVDNGAVTIKTDLNGVEITDEINDFGALYKEDYAAKGVLNDRWIPDFGAVKNYVDSSSSSTNIVDDLVAGGPGDALSAEQGIVLKSLIDNKITKSFEEVFVTASTVDGFTYTTTGATINYLQEIFLVRFTGTNAGSSAITIAGQGAPIRRFNGEQLEPGDIPRDVTLIAVRGQGTDYHLQGVGVGSGTTTPVSKVLFSNIGNVLGTYTWDVSLSPKLLITLIGDLSITIINEENGGEYLLDVYRDGLGTVAHAISFTNSVLIPFNGGDTPQSSALNGSDSYVLVSNGIDIKLNSGLNYK